MTEDEMVAAETRIHRFKYLSTMLQTTKDNIAYLSHANYVTAHVNDDSGREVWVNASDPTLATIRRLLLDDQRAAVESLQKERDAL